MSRNRIPSFARLRDLRPVFSVLDVRMLHGMSDSTARNALSRWTSKGMVALAGPKLGIYYNLVVDPRGRDVHLGTAILKEFRTAVLIGPSVLNDREWTTQQPHTVTVAVPEARSYPKIDGAATYGRPPEWFLHVHNAIRNELDHVGPGRYGLPSLPPEYALADMLKHGDCLHNLAPDDIEIPEDQVRPELLEEGFTALEVPTDYYMPYLRASQMELGLSFA